MQFRPLLALVVLTTTSLAQAAHAPLVGPLRLNLQPFRPALTIAQATQVSDPAVTEEQAREAQLQQRQQVPQPMDMNMQMPSQPFYTKWWFWGGIGAIGGAIGAFFALHKYPHHDAGPYHIHAQP